MNPHSPGNQLAVLVVFCVLGIFFFPALQGPYSAVHGPATALLSVRSRIRLCWAMAQAAVSAAFCKASLLRLSACRRQWFELSDQVVFLPPGAEAILRC